MPRLKKRRISDDFDDSPERKCKYIVPTERPYPYELVWGKMKSFPPWPGIVIDPPPPDRKPPGKKECYFYVYFFGSRDSAFVGSRHVFLYSMYHDECFENKNRDPSYIVSVKTAERLARHLKDENTCAPKSIETFDGLWKERSTNLMCFGREIFDISKVQDGVNDDIFRTMRNFKC
ncbi:hypothetical protein TNCT_467061 [Trichonephila clavata]|uniref:PWWP domain-containing protein n=1 Tax=Trichonephila clavata TaxID=2740835 RepID=A0A8X6GYF5_TRICU|nr:hypothetical protein TNCT_467061 [Trichonephila clavata]